MKVILLGCYLHSFSKALQKEGQKKSLRLAATKTSKIYITNTLGPQNHEKMKVLNPPI